MIPEFEEEYDELIEDGVNGILMECSKRNTQIQGNSYICRFSNRVEDCLNCQYDYGGEEYGKGKSM